MPDQDPKPPRHHLLIAGTGRAGTSFLVRWLAAAGLRTHLATHALPMWDDDANAGLEDLPVFGDPLCGDPLRGEPVGGGAPALPYVMKSPWLVEVIDDLLDNPTIVLDGVIIPVRDLTEAATSRVVRELQSAHRRNPWMAGLSRSFEQWGTTPGGVVYSLDPVDQARLLAVSFHRLVQRLVMADIPIVLLDFPRLVLDADYLFYKLRRFIPATIAQAREAHAAIADPGLVRVGRERMPGEAAAPRPGGEAYDRIDALALRREVRRLASALAAAERAVATHQTAAADLRSARDAQAVELAGLAAPALEPDAADRQRAQVADLVATVEQRRAEAAQAAITQQEAIAGLRRALDGQAAELAGLISRLSARDANLELAQAQLVAATAAAEHWQGEAERVTAEQQTVAGALRGALDARSSELARLATTLEARDADLQAAQARVATLTEAGEQRRAEAERALADQQVVAAGLRGALATRDADLAVLCTTLNQRDAELAQLGTSLEARGSDLAAAEQRIATLTATAERQRTDAAQAAAQQHAVIADLRGTVDAQATELARLAATLEARCADLEAAQTQAGSLTAALRQHRAETERAMADQQAVAAGLRSALGANAVELSGLAATLEARNASLDTARAEMAGLAVTVQQQRAAAELAAAEHRSIVTGLRGTLDARAAELAEAAATLAARDADLAAAQVQVATLTAGLEQLQAERAAMLARWTWRAGRPLRRAGHAVVTALHRRQPPVA